MSIFKKIKESLSTPYYGCPIFDPREPEEKGMDYIHGLDTKAMGGKASFEYNAKRPEITISPIRKQYQVGSCGANAAAHAARITKRIKDTSTAIWYSWRGNSGEGMWLNDVLEAVARWTEVPYDEYPNETYNTEDKANMLRGVIPKSVDKDNGAEYFALNGSNMVNLDEVAYITNVLKLPVIIAFYSTVNEWSYEKMTLRDKDVTLYNARVRHYNCIVPDGSWKDANGNIWYTTVESSPQGGWQVRDISRDFLLERMYLCGYATLPIKSKKPKLVIPTKGSEYQRDTVSETLTIQKYLVNKGYLSEKHCTGFYGEITRKAVLKWQLDNIKLFTKRKYSQAQLIADNGRYFGRVSLLVAKELN